MGQLERIGVRIKHLGHWYLNEWPRSYLLHCVLIVFCGFVSASNTLVVPFQWDEGHFIRDNEIIHDLSHFADPSGIRDHHAYPAFKGRYIGYLTFAINYSLHGTDVLGYHVFNIVVHLANGLLVYVFVLLLFKTPCLRQCAIRKYARYLALLAGLIFVVHPVQTHSVTYIFQRLNELAVFFYLAALVGFVKFRLMQGAGGKWRYALYLAVILSAILAMRTKEVAFTLPLILVMLEFFFFSGPVIKRVLVLLPLLVTMFIIPLHLIGIDRSVDEFVEAFGPVTRSYEGFTRLDYMLTQLRVVVTYLRLVLLPVGQNIDYDYPLFRSFFDPQVFLSFLLIAALLGLAAWFYVKSRSPGSASLRLVSFGILWFFITLSVESTIIPIPMLINEYRVYLPSVGAIIALLAINFIIIRWLNNAVLKMLLVLSLVLLPIVFSAASYARNEIWTTKVSLWTDTVQKSPNKVRPRYNLALAYQEEGLIDLAIKHYKLALVISPYEPRIHNNLGLLYFERGDALESIKHLKMFRRYTDNKALAAFNIGLVYIQMGEEEKVIREFEFVRKHDPSNKMVKMYLDQVRALKAQQKNPAR